jgi:acetoin utilization protein AcuB
MLVKERMSHPVITVKPGLPIMDALNMMQRERIRRAPVVENGKMVGIVSDRDLLNAGPSDATTLSVWEINYLISKIKVQDVMTRSVLSIDENTPIEEAARLMADNKIGGLPVTHNGDVVGIITETDLFKVFLELMGARDPGVRVAALVPDEPGVLANITRAVARNGGDFVSFGVFSGTHATNRLITFKVGGVSETQIRDIVTPMVEQIVDLRMT